MKPRAGTPVGRSRVAVSAVTFADHFEYAPYMTLASSPIDDVLEQGKGVCQDFTHLMIAVLRSFGCRRATSAATSIGPTRSRRATLGARSGCRSWDGSASTRPMIALSHEHFVKVAVGRDFTDVPPNKGTYRGEALERIFVRVETRTLESLPSRAWQEQLPPLQAPLTAIVPRKRLPGSRPGGATAAVRKGRRTGDHSSS